MSNKENIRATRHLFPRCLAELSQAIGVQMAVENAQEHSQGSKNKKHLQSSVQCKALLVESFGIQEHRAKKATIVVGELVQNLAQRKQLSLGMVTIIQRAG